VRGTTNELESRPAMAMWKRSRMKRLTAAGVTVAAVMCTMIGLAAGHVKKWPASTTAQIASLDVSHVVLSGKISSPKAKCEKRRSVEIVSGDGSDTLDIVYSKAGGSWSSEFLTPNPGPVRVEVGKEFFPFKPGHRHSCKKAATTVTIPTPPGGGARVPRSISSAISSFAVTK
jgi:hypothetical protein